MSDEFYIREEIEKGKQLSSLINENADLFKYHWKYGDGKGAAIFEQIRKVVVGEGIESSIENKGYSKKKISHSLQKRVFEKDAYRCKRCGSHVDLCVDHIKPEALGGGLEPENLQTLCRSCNSIKGKRY